MPVLPKRKFNAGEIDPSLRVDVDSEDYQSGLSILRNCVGKKMGGFRNRAGTRFVCQVNNYSSQRLLEFDYADGFNDSFALEFGAGYMRPLKAQVPVRETPLAITNITNANPGVFTIAGNGFNAGDEVYLDGEAGMTQINGRSVLVYPIDDNTFFCTDLAGNIINTTDFYDFEGGATAAKTYIIQSPFTSMDLPYLNYDQSFDQIKVASGTKPLQDVDYLADDNWTISPSLFAPSIAAPVGLEVSVTGTDSTYAVTALKIATGEESLAATIQGATGSTGTPQVLTWDNQADAFFYNVYRADENGMFGLIGVAAAQGNPTFTDTNVPGPDYDLVPPGINGALFDFGFNLKPLAASVFPGTPLPGNGTALAWSPDGTMLAVGMASAPYLQIYTYQSGIFTLLASPLSANPPGPVNELAWSPDGTYLAAACSPVSGSVYAVLYGVAAQTFTAQTTGFTQPTGNALGVCWNASSSLVCFAHASSPYMTVLSRAGSTFTKLADPITSGGSNPQTAGSGNPKAQGNCCVFLSSVFPADNPDVTDNLIVGCNYDSGSGQSVQHYSVLTSAVVSSEDYASPLFNDYNQYDTWAENLDTQTCDVLSVICTPSSAGENALPVLTFGLAGDGYVQSYLYKQFYIPSLNFYAYVWVSLPQPVALPQGDVTSLTQDGDGSYVLLTSSTAPYLMLYDMIAGTLVIDPDQPTPNLGGPGTCCAFSPDATQVAATFTTASPYAVMYESSVITPRCVGFGQQRVRIANIPPTSANTAANPATEFDSAEDAYTNFAIRTLPVDSDPIQFTTWSRKYNAIKHVLSLKKLIQLTTNGAIVLEGDQNGSISPDLQGPRLVGFNGANYVRPCMVGESALYVGAAGNTVFDLKKEVTASSYFSSDNFFATDLTSPSWHLFKNLQILATCYQEKPDSVAWFVMDDGTARSLTYVREQGVFTWAHHDMGDLGQFLDCCCIRESDGTDRVYFVVAVNSPTAGMAPTKMIVALQDREVTDLDSQWFVDCGVEYDAAGNPNWTLGFGWVTTGGPYFARLTVPSSSILLENEGIYRLYQTTSGNPDFPVGSYIDLQVGGEPDQYGFPVTILDASVPASVYNNTSFAVSTNEWTKPTNYVQGLWHLEGQEVSILGDGCVLSSPNNPFLKNSGGTLVPPITVSNGIADFSALGILCEKVIVGLPFTADVETLEMDAVQGPSLVEVQKNVPRPVLKVDNTKGLFFSHKGPAVDEGETYNDSAAGMFQGFTGNRQSIQDVVGKPGVALVSRKITSPIDGDWNSLGRVFIRQVDPCPMEINAIYCPTAV
jgi:hypothetical protein